MEHCRLLFSVPWKTYKQHVGFEITEVDKIKKKEEGGNCKKENRTIKRETSCNTRHLKKIIYENDLCGGRETDYSVHTYKQTVKNSKANHSVESNII